MGDALTVRLNRVRAEIRSRGLRVDPPRTEADVAAFEARAGIRLPEDYRRFLLEVADGPRLRVWRDFVYGEPVGPDHRGGFSHINGVAYDIRAEHRAEQKRREGPPYYGLHSLDHVLDQKIYGPKRPAVPFPLQSGWHWDSADFIVDESLIAPVYRNGTIELGGDGCGIGWVLVVAGPQYGRIWMVDEFGAYPCNPPLSFLDWYEAWLDGKPYWPAHPSQTAARRPTPPDDSGPLQVAEAL